LQEIKREKGQRILGLAYSTTRFFNGQ